MNSQEKFEYWLENSQYNFKAAESMFKSELWLYVCFMYQQSIEKLSKGLFTLFISDDVPRIHNLNKIITHFSDKLPTILSEEHKNFLNYLSEFYIESRYPDFKQNLSKQIDKDKAKYILTMTKEIQLWLMKSQKCVQF